MSDFKNIVNNITEKEYFHIFYDYSELRILNKEIQNYFKNKYSKKVNIININGIINLATLKKLFIFANNKKDNELIYLVNKYINEIYEKVINKKYKNI